MKYKKHSRVKTYIRHKILLPIANFLIGAYKPYFVRKTINGEMWEARYSRSRYWWDSERITIAGILRKRKIYYATFWCGGTEGRSWVQPMGFGSIYIHTNRGDDIESLVSRHLGMAAEYWNKVGQLPEEVVRVAETSDRRETRC